MMPNEDGSQNTYPYFLKRDMSKIKHVFTDADFNNVPVGSYNDDIARYAYIYYIMGNNVGDEFIMNVNYWNRGFEIDPTETSQEKTKYFNNTQNKIYRTTWPFDHNKITSMTPIDNAPQNPQQWDLYYKSNVNSWDGISQRAVVTWDGSKWIIATGYTNEWSEQTDYNATNYMEKI